MSVDNLKKIFLSVVLNILLLTSIKQPMAFVFGIGVAALLFTKPLRKSTKNFRTSCHFVSIEIRLGMLTEITAIFDNIDKPPQERILLYADRWLISFWDSSFMRF